jgi:hypothetical protein
MQNRIVLERGPRSEPWVPEPVLLPSAIAIGGVSLLLVSSWRASGVVGAVRSKVLEGVIASSAMRAVALSEDGCGALKDAGKAFGSIGVGGPEDVPVAAWSWRKGGIKMTAPYRC